MIIAKWPVIFWILVNRSHADCGADKECRDFRERMKRNSNNIIRDKTFKKVEVYNETATVFDEFVWPG